MNTSVLVFARGMLLVSDIVAALFIGVLVTVLAVVSGLLPEGED